jgi:hypothetical protein
LKKLPSGGDSKNCIPMIIVNKAANPTEPAPTNEIAFFESFFPKKVRIRKPRKGSAGTNHK